MNWDEIKDHPLWILFVAAPIGIVAIILVLL